MYINCIFTLTILITYIYIYSNPNDVFKLALRGSADRRCQDFLGLIPATLALLQLDATEQVAARTEPW